MNRRLVLVASAALSIAVLACGASPSTDDGEQDTVQPPTAAVGAASQTDGSVVDAPSVASGNETTETDTWVDTRPAERGHNVGDFAPEFAMTLADGIEIVLADLVSQSQPAFLFFFATW